MCICINIEGLKLKYLFVLLMIYYKEKDCDI